MPKPLHSSVRRDEYITIRVTANTKDQVRQLAKKNKQSISDLMDSLIDKELKRANL